MARKLTERSEVNFLLLVLAAEAAIHDTPTVALDARNNLILRYFSHQLAWMAAFAAMTEIGMLTSLRSANILSVNIIAGWY